MNKPTGKLAHAYNTISILEKTLQEIRERNNPHKGHDTVVYVADKNGDLLFIRTFDVKGGGEPERLAAIECYTKVSEVYGYGTVSAKSHVKIQTNDD